MADLVTDFVTNTLFLLTKPLLWFGSIFMAGFMFIFIVIDTCCKLVASMLFFYLSMLRKTLILILAFCSFPVRVLCALQRERQLEGHINEMEIVMENLTCSSKEINEQLQKECKTYKLGLAEAKEEIGRACSKIDSLERELQQLRFENLKLRRVLSRYTGSASKGDMAGYAIPNHAMPRHIPRSRQDKELLQKWEIALSRSFFSGMLSLLVGTVIWEASEPCAQLVAALGIVVAMSLQSVVRFFSALKTKPDADAVALLSFNWFLLGALSCPALPQAARLLVPFSSRLVLQSIRWISCFLKLAC